MRDISYLAGYEEFKNLNKYAHGSMTKKDRATFEKISQKMQLYIKEKSDDFITFSEGVTLKTLWSKYGYLKPFIFKFDPAIIMPKVFKNKTALVIWSVWRAWHLKGQEDLEGAALAAAKILEKSKKPYPKKIKIEAVHRFKTIMYGTGYPCYYDLEGDFWDKKIFPYLEGKIEFRYEVNC